MDDLVVVAANVDEGVARLEAVMGIAAEMVLTLSGLSVNFLSELSITSVTVSSITLSVAPKLNC